MRATKLVQEIKHLSYIDRLKYIHCYIKNLEGIRFWCLSLLCMIQTLLVTWLNLMMSLSEVTIFDCMKGTFIMTCVNIFLGNCVLSNCNKLPDYVITANSVGIIESRLDQLGSNQACYVVRCFYVSVAVCRIWMRVLRLLACFR
jgi:hypothetical protein